MKLFDFIFGRRLATREQLTQKIGIWSGLPALGLDGLSSSAYGPEAALTILLPLGLMGVSHVVPITGLILALLVMLYISYRQTIEAYPANGGSYTVAKENLGTYASLFAAAALMIDYVLTVAVGISAGVAAVVSALPHLHKYTLPICLAILVLITLLNLRGTSEAGTVFALPTYIFITSMFVVLGWGMIKAILSGGHPHAQVAPPELPVAAEGVGLWILLRSFASGCTAMTGVEAVSNGVSAFKEPTVKNAQRTLTLIVGILAILLGGIAYLARAYHIGAMIQDHPGYQSVISQLVAAVAGKGWFYYVTMVSVLAVLCLSANTSFVGFPLLCRLIAKDDFLPRSFAAIDRRLVYSVGVLFLATACGVLIAVFRGITDKLIPLYAVGAFLAFTLSQSGMVMHWWKAIHQAKEPKNPLYVKLCINGIGAVATAATLCIIIVAKFVEGAWIVVLAIPLTIAGFWVIRRHYDSVRRQVACELPLVAESQEKPVVIVPIRDWDRLVAKSLRFAMHLSPDVLAVHLSNLEGDAADDEATRMRGLWSERVQTPMHNSPVPSPKLELVRTPFREFTEPLMKEIDKVKVQFPHRLVAVIIPEIVEKYWWHRFLHSRRASRLRNALCARQDVSVVVIDLPWFIADENGKPK